MKGILNMDISLIFACRVSFWWFENANQRFKPVEYVISQFEAIVGYEGFVWSEAIVGFLQVSFSEIRLEKAQPIS